MSLSIALTAGIDALTRQLARMPEYDFDGRIATVKVIADYSAKLIVALEADWETDREVEAEADAAMDEAEARARWHAQCDADLEARERGW